MANAMIAAGHITRTDWSEALGAARSRAAAKGAPDTEESYYLAALDAVEGLATASGRVTTGALTARKEAWAQAYRRTPHGQPVTLLHPAQHVGGDASDA